MPGPVLKQTSRLTRFFAASALSLHAVKMTFGLPIYDWQRSRNEAGFSASFKSCKENSDRSRRLHGREESGGILRFSCRKSAAFQLRYNILVGLYQSQSFVCIPDVPLSLKTRNRGLLQRP